MTDIMSPEARSRLMSRIHGKDTGIEKAVRHLLDGRGLGLRRHGKGIPGRPDFYCTRRQVAIFVDGDFWHGWMLPRWERKLAPFWQRKIAANRRRDRRNHALLRGSGWEVVRIWEHQVERTPGEVLRRILRALARAGGKDRVRGARPATGRDRAAGSGMRTPPVGCRRPG